MLLDKIWKTRLCRIHTEKRLRNNARFFETLMIFYSVLLVWLSIWNLLHSDERLNLFLVLGSVTVLVLTVFLSAQKFIERSMATRNCYIKLDELYCKVERAEAAEENDLKEHLQSEYSSILQNVDNHSYYDYLVFRWSKRDDEGAKLPPFTYMDWTKLGWYGGCRILSALFFLILPFMLIIILPGIIEKILTNGSFQLF